MSWRVTIACSRAQGEAIGSGDDIFPNTAKNPPVLVADEPDASKPEQWLIHAYFEHSPNAHEISLLRALGSGEPRIEELGEADWVTMSQAGLQPIRAGRFYVHTPMHHNVPPATVPFEIDASLAFGTGQHATTSGCLEALDRLEREGAQFSCIADIGTGTGLLAFAGLALWPRAKCIATDIDRVAVDVARDNALINRVKLGHGAGELLIAQADGMNSPLLSARAPFDLIIANILAGPLIELAPDFAASLARGGVVVLAGLLGHQADRIVQAYEEQGLRIRDRGFGEWPVLVCERAA